MIVSRVRRPVCSTHPDEGLRDVGSGWFCGLCGRIAVSMVDWPGSAERLTAGLEVEEWPTPLAAKALEIDAEEHPVVRLWALCELVELVLRLCTAIGAAEVQFQVGGLPDDLARKFLEGGPRIRRPTQDGWLRLSRAAAAASDACPRSAERLVPELLADVANVLGPLIEAKDDPEWGLNRLRNGLAHGGGLNRESAGYVVGRYVRRVREALCRFGWLRVVGLVARCEGVEMLLRGHSPVRPASFACDSKRLGGVEVEARRGAHSRRLSPLFSMVVPPGEHDPVPSVYVRGSEDHLEHVPTGPFGSFIRLKGDALRSFDRSFRLSERGALLGELEDFDGDFSDEAARFVGRDSELRRLTDLVAQTARPAVLWIHGAAGAGKSALAAKLSTILIGRAKTAGKVVRWRFRAGDPRCTRAHFLKHVLHELGQRELVAELGDGAAVLEARVADVLRAAPGAGVVLIVDGLDEIAGSDADFVELPGRLATDRILWVCTGRFTANMQSLAHGWAVAFEGDGVGPLSPSDVAAWIRNEMPERQRALLLRNDERWLEDVVRASGGLPQYVQLLLEDLARGEVVVGSHLPQGLGAYWEKLLRSAGADDVSGIVPVLMAAIVMCIEAPTPSCLAAILLQAGTLARETADGHVALVEQAILRIRHLLRVESVGSGTRRLLPAHESLRQHIRTSPNMRNAVARVREALCELSMRPSLAREHVVREYFFSVGVRHLLAEGQTADAASSLSSFGYLQERLAAWRCSREAIGTVLADLGRILQEHPDAPEEVSAWQLFFERDAYRVGGSNTSLLQLAIGEGSQLLRSIAQAWLDRHGSPPWLEVIARSTVDSPSGPRMTLGEPGRGAVALAFHPSGRWLVIGSEDGDASVWDLQTATRISTLEGCIPSALRFDAAGRLFASVGTEILVWSFDDAGGAQCIERVDLGQPVRSFTPGREGTLVGHMGGRGKMSLIVLPSRETLATAGVGFRTDKEVPALLLPSSDVLSGRAGGMVFDTRVALSGEVARLKQQIFETALVDLERGLLLSPGMFGNLYCLDLATLDVRSEIAQTESFVAPPTAMDVSRDAGVVAVGSHAGDLLLFDLVGRHVGRLAQAHANPIDVVAASADGKHVASAASNHAEAGVRVWQTSALFPDVSRSESTGPVLDLLFGPDDTVVARLSNCYDGALSVWDPSTGRMLRELGGAAKVSAFSAEHGRLANADLEGATEVDVRTGEPSWYWLPEHLVPAAEEADTNIIELEYCFGGAELWATVSTAAGESETIRWCTTTHDVLEPTAPHARLVKSIGDREVWLDPSPEPQIAGAHASGQSFVKIQLMEVTRLDDTGSEPRSWRELRSAQWHHDRLITAVAASLEGRVAIGDDLGRILFLRLHESTVGPQADAL